jgi:uncharacterized SAM-binding protein YcdF (DUF218 family)
VAPSWLIVSRSAALFLGGFSLLNLLGEFQHPGFDANLWWIDLRPAPLPLLRGLLAFAGLVLCLYAVFPSLPAIPRLVVVTTVLLLVGTSVMNTIGYYRLLQLGQIKTEARFPFSIEVICVLLVILIGTLQRCDSSRVTHRDLAWGALTLLLCVTGFPLSQIYCYGKTDYRRQADVIVVFGCKVYADGRPSTALLERLQTACELYGQGLASAVIVSGGPGSGDTHETQTMRRLAIELGVPAEHVLVDPHGLNTEATVRNTVDRIQHHDWKRVLAVSHFYHLPRVKLCYRRHGIQVYTVPASSPRGVPRLAFQTAREVLALWYYYLRPLSNR